MQIVHIYEIYEIITCLRQQLYYEGSLTWFVQLQTNKFQGFLQFNSGVVYEFYFVSHG